MREAVDALVVGAGPAGLAAATYLARFRRSLLVIDAGASRAAWIPVSHNQPGFPEGISGPALLTRMRTQAEHHGVRILGGEVERLERLPDGRFRAAFGEEGEVVAQRVLLATGCEDVEPPLPGVAEAVRRGLIRHCPICDAYEVIGQKVALIGYGTCRVREALLLRAYTADLTLLTLGRPLDVAEDDAALLREAGVRRLDQPVARVAVEGGRIATWTMQDGSEHSFDTLYSALGVHLRSRLAIALGAAVDADGALLVDSHQCTSIPGLFAAGDVVSGLSQVSVAMGQAAIAATTLNRSLPFPRAPEAAPARPLRVRR